MRRLTVSFLLGLAVAACGSGSGSGRGSGTTGASTAAAQSVKRALAAVRNRAFHETFTEDIALKSSGVPAAEAAKLNQFSGTVSGTADVADSKNFHVVVMLHGVRAYARAVNGHLSISQDGINYQPAPPATATRFSQLISVAPSVLSHVQNVRSLGTAQVTGQTVNRYSATIPAGAVAPVFSAMNLSSGKPGALHFTIDVSRSTGLPVRYTDAESALLDLSKLGHPGVTGNLSVNVTSVRNFSYR